MLTLLVIITALQGCKEIIVPKPKGYFRIDLPSKNYVSHDMSLAKENALPFSFEYPSYGKISYDFETMPEPGWFNIDFQAYKARIYLTYRNIDGNLADLIEQTYEMNIKNHIAKADAINEQIISNQERKIFGILYDLKGNTATSTQFYITDSINHYLRGSLYFSAEPNADSLSPVISFLREDIVHMIETLKWKEKLY
jgi:gliding motility-associated lipoprotein GldD